MSIGPWQVIIILVIILILFGAGKLPRVMGDLARGVKNFKKGLNEDEAAEEAEKPGNPEKARTIEHEDDPPVAGKDDAADGADTARKEPAAASGKDGPREG